MPMTTTTFLSNGITAHRGNSAELPENTMAAFDSAIALGADWIELDVHATEDGQLVVLHDFDTARVGDASLVVADSTYGELRQVDVASAFREGNGMSLDDCPRSRVPLLHDVLKMIQSQRRTRLSMQPKSKCVDDCVSLAADLSALEWIGFNDGDVAKMARVKELVPRVPAFWDRGPDTDIAGDVEVALAHGFESIVVNRQGVTRSKVVAIHAAGLEAGAWTVNDADEMRRFLDWGVDRLYTDAPRAMIEAKRGTGACHLD